MRSWLDEDRSAASPLHNHIKRQLIRREGLPEELLVDFELDHRIPLCPSGSAGRSSQLPTPAVGWRRPERITEACLCRAVCGGKIGLGEARRRIWANWHEAGKACEGLK